MRIGSLFSGIGGLDLAVEIATGGQTVWQVESNEHCRQVLARHWPEAARHNDVCSVGSGNLAAIDVLCGGSPCTDLSAASPTKTGLKGERSGLFYEFVRIAKEMQPQMVVIENVPPLLKQQATVDAVMADAGYACSWLTCYASTTGAPHLRQRVFVVCTKSDGFALTAEPVKVGKFERGLWPTPKSRDFRSGKGTSEANLPKRVGSRDLPELLRGKLNPAWVECLMGLPAGWTLPTGSSQRADAVALLHHHHWPAGKDQDQRPWEPPRLQGGPPVRGRPARMVALGNAVVPQQALLALSHLLPTTEATT